MASTTGSAYLSAPSQPHFTQEISYPVAGDLQSVLPQATGEQRTFSFGSSSSSSSSPSSGYGAPAVAPSTGYGVPAAPAYGAPSYSSSDSYLVDDDEDVSYKTTYGSDVSSKPLASKYFGVTTTNSRDIQV